ncbi:MAG: hypothetical protein AAFR59_13290, partial [Bacteroidota bacterium]
MKRAIKTWTIRFVSFGLISVLTIIVAVLNPSFLYAHKTEVGNYTVYHEAALPAEFESRLAAVHERVKQSEWYDSTHTLKLCLNDGSLYPEMMEALRGPAFGWGFFDLAVFRGTFDFEANTVSLRGYKWNLEQLMTHELVHCLQFHALGLWQSNPLGSHPHWKWEGYPEYISRKGKDQLSLRDNIRRMEEAWKTAPKAWGIPFEDGTIAPRTYYEAWLLVKFCLEIKGMTYAE